MAELFVRASLPNEGHASVRLDCREGIICNLDRCERRRSEEGGLANVRFPDDPQLHEATKRDASTSTFMARPTDKFLRAFRGYKRSRLCFCLRRDETRRTIIPPISAGPPASENSGIGTVSELSEDGGLPSYSNVTVVPATKSTRRLNLWVARRVTAF